MRVHLDLDDHGSNHLAGFRRGDSPHHFNSHLAPASMSLLQDYVQVGQRWKTVAVATVITSLADLGAQRPQAKTHGPTWR